MTQARPALDQQLSGDELLRWYWLRSELAVFARSLGVAAGGSKQELTARLVAHLEHRTPPARAPRRRRTPPALPEPLTATTLIPVGQRRTQQLRRHFTAVIGPSFTLDAAMRDVVAAGAGRTLGAAADHWHRTRERPAPPIGQQFELNRFVRHWHQLHPGGSRTQALEAWRHHRALPADARPAV